MRWTIPNILTVGRLVAAPAFALVFVLVPRPLADLVALLLFIGAALTDYLDGWLARRWGQVSNFGRMLDPIADKAMVVIALAVVMGLSGMNTLVLIPATVILFREVFVSGLREFLGAQAGLLKVTRLAKWKTTVQMFALPALLVTLMLQAQIEAIYYAMEPARFEAILAGQGTDPLGLRLLSFLYDVMHVAGLVLLWLAALLTAVTGLDYFVKSLPYLREAKE
ncbi:CDP-diacylglycerol--glycerol-3-phosphate 3-phosphatidyltransferase [Halovulum dunhuangense]|uniref:CDP-diacylglycerol--glycerol-3-phosphate 3-phosphatidyltransferase n=1 Tax=Halovulum dunhuangense TaxID=1505036 RepID=A0A849KW21_9RHOB|nr:CDP-diacylglycerol--glycerol-3-phosphate 3-phosphatidyltransferase [Halovulum dunhuangense]NNU79668.1 CDP-diacylglycerol--glycerol-3-phosphate 3-phosphatidyltransferase [Halovulum dunhuangense]